MNDFRDLGQGSKMRAASPILVVAEPDKSSGDSWRRFLAVLCFMEFYTGLVRSGTILWESWSDDFSPLSANPMFWANAILLFRAFCLYICGRALWFGSKHAGRWVFIALVLTLVTLIWVAWSDYRAFCEIRGSSLPIWPARPWANLSYILRNAVQMVPLLTCFVISLLFRRSATGKGEPHTARWVVLASAWCFAVAVEELLVGNAGAFLAFCTQSIHLETGALYVYAAVVAGTGVLLILKAVPARTAALILAAIGVVYAAEESFVLPWLVNIAIHALYLSVPGYPGGLSYRWVHTRQEFLGVFVDSVRLVGPWLLIALYARFVPMRTPPDDGSPYPRRYCRKCLYNLHGLESDRCPECGTELGTGSPTA
ncbi:MAG TPA: hypothetical protein PLL20_21015 [Phycisphaerae bacterium]|nr:hypothetical protein [Phycisphaerae bacterium]HRR87370.1 hypothetical protein [Phycisphaerae bacterium]